MSNGAISLAEMLERKQGRLKSRNRLMRPPTPSKRTEVWYRDQLIAFIKMMQDVVIEDLQKPILNDAPFESVLSITARLSRAIQKLANMSILDMARRLSFGMVRRANDQNKSQTQKTYKAAFGIDLTGMLGDGAVKEHLENAVKENVDLIQSIQTDFINDIGEKVFANLTNGGRHENLVSLIRERGNVTQNRAKFIARDQTAKLNSALTETRSKTLGLDLYEWGGAGDERERASHFVLNGKTCKYSDPTVYSEDGGKTWKKRSGIKGYEGAPGTDYQCRCVALPKVSWD
ncbi:phage minor head protein [Xenorhabdus griffiniae]|uniref:phage head morphogenesis protein n=1 Tax=Xenorhabdus griffiniae TaxID=351672 RepID=UPI002358AAD2|nr:phage minor head protein [Xenorhabdus griffiniae]MDC9606852.1 phage minor head protein [Xenorhabdus griffiniae]